MINYGKQKISYKNLIDFLFENNFTINYLFNFVHLYMVGKSGKNKHIYKFPNKYPCNNF